MGKVIDKYPMNTAPEWKGKEVEQLKFVEIAGGMLPESDENSWEIRQIFVPNEIWPINLVSIRKKRKLI
jgi:hypothetical protein